MMRVNKKIEYGVIALLYLADKTEQTASVREMAQSCNIPETLLSKIMQSMKNVGFVQPVHGNQGGYRLNRTLGDINLLELTQTLQGPIQVAECLAPGTNECPARSNCTIITPMNVLNQKIVSLFQSTSLEALANRKEAI